MSKISFTPQQVEDLLKEQVKIVRKDIQEKWSNSQSRKAIHGIDADNASGSDSEMKEMFLSLDNCRIPRDLAVIKKYSEE